MARGLMMILAAFVLMGGVAAVSRQTWETRRVDLAHLPEDPNIFDCKQIARLYEREVEALAKAMTGAAYAPPAASKGRFVSAGETGAGIGSVSKSDSTGFGGTHARMSLLDKVERYLRRECGAGNPG